MTDERIAILENELRHTKLDLDKFFAFVRAHMEKEEKDRAELIELIHNLKTRVDRQTYFVSGVVSTFTTIWVVLKIFL